jgi:hypothetical protein
MAFETPSGRGDTIGCVLAHRPSPQIIRRLRRVCQSAWMHIDIWKKRGVVFNPSKRGARGGPWWQEGGRARPALKLGDLEGTRTPVLGRNVDCVKI